MSRHIAPYLAVLVSIASLMFVLFVKTDSDIDHTSLLSIAGTIITALSFVFALFFVILAISAYSHVKEIATTAEKVLEVKSDIDRSELDIDRHMKEIYLIREESDKVFRGMISILDDFMSHQISLQNLSLSNIDKDRRRYVEDNINTTIRKRALLALRYNYLDDSLRVNHIRELIAVGKKGDLIVLKQASENISNSQEVKDLANFIYRTLSGKFNA